MNQVINSCLTVLNNVGRGFCDYSASIFIQSSVLIVLLLIIDFLIRKHVRAAFRYWIWMLVFVKLILPPAFSLPTGIGYWRGDFLSTDSPVLQQASNAVRPEHPIAPAPEDFTIPAEIPQDQPSQINPRIVAPATSAGSVLIAPSWQAVIFVLWLVGVLVILVLLIQRMLFVKGLIAQSEPAKNRLVEMLNQCRRQVGIRGNIELRLSGKISGPAVCGLFKPAILIPAALIEKLSPDKLRAVLIHELAHIKRGDLWINFAQTILQIIYFYNPLVWLANAVVRRIREQAVDEMVLVALGEGAKSYSNTLIDIAEMAFFRTSLSLRLIGVVESKKALHRRIRHILNRPIPKTAKLGILGLLAVIITAALLLPMAKALDESNFKAEGGPLDIRLVGVRPDGGDEIYDAEGKKTGKALGPIDVWESPWGNQKQRRDFVFELPAVDGQILFLTWPRICVAGTDRRLSCSLGHSVGQSDGRKLFMLVANFPRTYRQGTALLFNRQIPVRKIDLTLRYYYGQRKDAFCTFTGPFEVVKKVVADGSQSYELTPEKVDLPQSEVYRFHFSDFEFDNDSPVLIYDVAGKRHLVPTVTHSFFEIHDLPLDKIAAITLGEKPHERIFCNIVVDYPDQPVRDYPGYLDKLAERLGAAELSKEKLAQYDFSDPCEALAVIDIIGGRWLTMWALEALMFSKPTVDISTLDQKDQDRIRRTANVWAAGIDLRIRARGIQLGLVGKWPGFFEQALMLLSDDYQYLSSNDLSFVRSELSRIVWILMNRYRQQLTPQQFEELKEYYNGRRDLPILSLSSLRKPQRPGVQAEVLIVEDVNPTPLSPALLLTPILGYDVRLNFADPTIRDGSFHSKQSVAFVMSFHSIEDLKPGVLLSGLLIGQRTFSLILKDNRITIQDGSTGREIQSESWSAGQVQFNKVITLPVNYGQKEYSCPIHVEMDRHDEGVLTGSYWFCAYLSGRLPWGAGGRVFEIVNLDQQMEFRLTGDGTDKRDAVLGIDINGDGKINPTERGGEQFDLYEPFQIRSKTYRVTEVDPYLPRVVFHEVSPAQPFHTDIKTDVQVEPEKTPLTEFTATLPNGVTVELVGLCEEPVGGAKWWKPDGSDMPEPFFRASKRTPPLKGVTTQYTFLAKAEGSEDISIKMKIYEGFGWSTKAAEDGTTLCYIKHRNDAKPYHEDAFSQGPIEVGVAQGQWIKGRGESSPNIQTPRSYSIGSHDEIVIQPPRPEKNSPETATIFWFTSSSHDYEYRLICTLKDGSVEECMKPFFQSTNTIEAGNLKNSTLNTKSFNIDRPLEQIVNYELLYRKFDYARFNNVSFKPNAKTDVRVEVEPEVSKLLTALQSEKYVHIREGIVRLVEETGDNDPVSFLVEQLQFEDRSRRCAAALALELLGDRRGIPAIIKELNDASYRPTTMIRSDGREYQEGQIIQDHYYAALLLGILGDARAVPALIEATGDETINYQAAMSLGQIGDKRAVPALRSMLEKNLNKPFQRLFAGYGLAMLGDDEGLKVVIDTLNNQQLQWTVRRHAIETLGMLGDKQAVPYLIAALKDDHPNIRVSAAQALGAIGDASALPALEEALKDKTETKVNAPTTVSKAATEAIARIKAGNGRIADVQVDVQKSNIRTEEERSEAKTTLLPDVDSSGLMLDLGSGELLEIPKADTPEDIALAIEKLNKGDLVFDSSSLILVRGATTKSLPDTIIEPFKTYEIGQRLPEILNIKTKEGIEYTIEICSVDKDGCQLEYYPLYPNNYISAIPLNALEHKFIEQVLELVKQVEEKYPEQATHWPAGPGLYHVDAQGQVTVWHYQRLWPRSKDCAEDEVGWGSSRLVNATGMYYLPDGTALQSRWRERGNGMKDIRVKVGRAVAESERVALIHRHRLPSDRDLLSRDGRERKILLDCHKDSPLAIIVLVDRPMRLSGWWVGNVETDVQHFDEYDQLLVTNPPGDNDKPMFVTVELPKETTTGQKIRAQVEGGSNVPIGEASKENKKPQDPNEPTYGGRSLTELIAALGEQDFQTRINAVYHIGYMGPKAKPAVPALVDALDEERLRESVLHSLGNIGLGAEEAIPALIKAIAEYAPACRCMAAESLAKIGKAAIPPLKKAARSEDIYLQIWCNAALAKQQGSDSPNLRYLAQLMKNADKRTASEAVQALTMLGPISKPLVPDLIEALKHSVVPKKHIAFALAQTGKDAGPAVQELTKMLQDTDLGTRADAIYALSRIGGPDIAPAVPLLIQTLRTDDTSNTVMASRVRYTAATALGSVGPDARPAIPALVNALDDDHEFVRANSAKAIGDIDPTDLQAVPALLEAMKDESGRVRSAAAQALLRIGPVNKQVVLAFIRVSGDKTKYVIYATDDFFRLLGPEHRYIIPELAKMAEAPDARSRRLGISALVKIGDIPVELVPALVEALEDHRHDGPSVYAESALVMLGPKAKAAVPHMMEMLGGKSRTQKSTSARILAAIGTPEAREAIPVIEQYLKEDPFLGLCEHLLQFDPESTVALQALERIAKDPRSHAMDVPGAHYRLIRAGHNPEYHLQALIDDLESGGAGKWGAASYLGNLGNLATKAIPSLQKALKDDNPEVRVVAARSILLISLKPMERKKAADVILNAVEEKVFMARLRAFSALEAFGPDESWAVPSLITLATNASIPQERFRINAVKALGNIGPGAKDALPYLKQLMKEEDWRIRHFATQAIEKLGIKPVQVGNERY